jgi:3-phosphoshikimate 1-carboxyvinyltransferase
MVAHLSVNEPFSAAPTIEVTGSKSESNRLLILQALFPTITIKNLSESDDTLFLRKGLSKSTEVVDVHHAGTAMRFLTAYFAMQPSKEVLLTGSERMQERPIGILVDALRQLGAHITYVGREGYPPLSISGSVLTKNTIALQANVSSQFISALMLIAPALPNGLSLQLKGSVTSAPYIQMTLSLLHRIGIWGSFSEDTIEILPAATLKPVEVNVESDWSSASYFYSALALCDRKNAKITLKYYRENSVQGDAKVASIFEKLGVMSEFFPSEGELRLMKKAVPLPEHLLLHLADTPDLAQTIAVTCFGLGLGCKLTGLHTLKIKETDRLLALQNELEKLGATVSISDDSLELAPVSRRLPNQHIHTYNDHRMAMAFAPLAFKNSISVLDPMVVTKSFPTFWKDMEKLGMQVDIQ